MGINHLDTLHAELPELFQLRDLFPDWHEELIIIPVKEPERVIPEPTAIPLDYAKSVPDFRDDLSEAEWLENFGPEMDAEETPWFELSPVIYEVLGGSHPGAPIPYTQATFMTPPDCLAFYLPFHYYHPEWWGVYLIYDGVVWLANEIRKRAGYQISWHLSLTSARLFLYYHEAFHHKTECFATRLELTHRRPFYKTGFERYFQMTWETDYCLEEGLGNACALYDVRKKLRHDEIDRCLAGYVSDSPPGYDQGNTFRKMFREIRCKFAEENQHICLPHLPRKNPEVWQTAPHLFHGISTIKSRVNYVIHRNSPIAARLPFRPCLPPNKLVKKLREMVGLILVREGGRHQVWKTTSGRLVEIPRHPRDLGRGLLRKILTQAGIQMGLDEFLRT